MVNREEIVEALKQVMDPELGVDIYSLGLVYDITVDGPTIEIRMTFTSPMCPLGPMIVESVREQVSNVKGVQDVKVEITFDPPWTPDRISDEIRATLGI